MNHKTQATLRFHCRDHRQVLEIMKRLKNIPHGEPTYRENKNDSGVTVYIRIYGLTDKEE